MVLNHLAALQAVAKLGSAEQQEALARAEAEREDEQAALAWLAVLGCAAAGEVRVLLMSLKCGVGLNLTCANHVILCEPWWNPFAEDQACDRVHRIGQQKVRRPQPQPQA